MNDDTGASFNVPHLRGTNGTAAEITLSPMEKLGVCTHSCREANRPVSQGIRIYTPTPRHCFVHYHGVRVRHHAFPVRALRWAAGQARKRHAGQQYMHFTGRGKQLQRGQNHVPVQSQRAHAMVSITSPLWSFFPRCRAQLFPRRIS